MNPHRARLNGADQASGAASRSKGVALITTLILLGLLGAASLAITLLVSSDTMINGYYRNYRGSFYAADSGVHIVVNTIKNALQSATNVAANPPLPTGSIPNSVTSSYATYQNNAYSVGDAGSWIGKFQATNVTLSNPSPNAGQPFCIAQAGGSRDCNFIYSFSVTVKGTSSGTEAESVTETGTIRLHSNSGAPAGAVTPSFAKWGAFIQEFGDCQGPLVPGNMSGPFFTDEHWNFGNYTNPGYTFNGSVGQVDDTVSWWKNNKCTDATAAPNGFNSPTFKSGFNTKQTYIQPPQNSFNQAAAVLDGKGNAPCTSAPCPAPPTVSQTAEHNFLKTYNGSSSAAYPSSGTPASGVYLPYYPDPNNAGKYLYGSDPSSSGSGYGGGLLVEGNASVTLNASTDASNNPTQTYTITQGGATTTIVVDVATNTTTVSTGGRGSTPLTLTGVPTQLDPNTGQVVSNPEANGTSSPSNVSPTMVYVDGQVTGLSGTVQNLTGITVAASNDINITGDLTYVSQPVSIPSDTLTSGTNAGVLGIYTTGNINLSTSASSGNLTVDASLAALSGDPSGTSGFATTGTNKNCGSKVCTWTIVGGRSEDQAHSVSIQTGNTYYDQRYSSGSFGPPWFPTAVLQPGTTATAPSGPDITITRLSWQEANR